MPTYCFTKKDSGVWQGHDKTFTSIAKITEWVSLQPEKK